MSEVPAQYICADRIQRLSMVEDDSQVIDQLIERVRSLSSQLAEAKAALASENERVRSLSSQLAEAKAALAASENRENTLIDRIRSGL